MAFQCGSPFAPARTPRGCSNTPTPCRECLPSKASHRELEPLNSSFSLTSWSLWGTRRWRAALGARAAGVAATVTHAPQGPFTAPNAPVLGQARAIADATATEPLLSPASLARRAAVGTGHSHSLLGVGTAGAAAAAEGGPLRSSSRLPETVSQSSIPVNASVNGKLSGSATASRLLAIPMPPGAHAPTGTGRLDAVAAAARAEGTGGFGTPQRRASAPSSNSRSSSSRNSSRKAVPTSPHEEAPPDNQSTSSRRGYDRDSDRPTLESRGKGTSSKGGGGTRNGGSSRTSTRAYSRSGGGASKWSSYFNMAQVQDLQQLQELVDRRVGVWRAGQDPGPIQAAFNVAAKVPDASRAPAAGRSSSTTTTSTPAGTTTTTTTTGTNTTPSDASATPGTARWSVMHTLASIYLPLCTSLTLTRTADATIPLWACAKTGYGWRAAADEQPLAGALLKQLRANGFELVRNAKSNEVGNLVWALSKAPEDLAAGQRDLLGACAERLEGLAFKDINTQACSNVMLSFARLGVTRGSLLHHLTACLAQKAASAPSQELANSLYALGELAAGGGGAGPHVPRAEDLSAVRDEVVRRLEAGAGAGQQQQQQQQQGDRSIGFKSQEVSNMLLGCAKLAVDDPQLVVALAGAAARAARRMQPQELANSVWALGKLTQLPACASAAAPAVAEAVEQVAREVTARLKLTASAFNAQNLTNLLYGFAVLQQPASSTGAVTAAGADTAGGEAAAVAAGPRVGEAARALAAECLRRRFRSFNPQDVSNAAWGVAKLGHTDQQWYAAAVEAAQRPSFGKAATSQSWSSLWYALALAQHRPPEGLLRRTVAAVGAVAGGAWEQNCANQLWALALLGMYDRELVGAMLRRLLQLMAGGSLEMRDLTNSVWSVAVMGPEALRAHCGAVGQLLREVVVRWEKGNGRQELPLQELTQLWKVHLELEAVAKAEAAGSSSSSSSSSGGKDGTWSSGNRGGGGGGDGGEVSRVARILREAGRPGPDGCGPGLLVAMAQAAEEMQMRVEGNTGSRMQQQVYNTLQRVQWRQRHQQQGEEETGEEDEEAGGDQSGFEEQQLEGSTAGCSDGATGPVASDVEPTAEGPRQGSRAQGRQQGQGEAQGQWRGQEHVACVAASDRLHPAIVSLTPEAPVFELRSRVDMVVEFEGGRKMVVEVDGPMHFFANRPYTTLRNGTTALRDRQLERLYGHANLVRVPYWEWTVVQGSRAQREAYLLGLLYGTGCGVEQEQDQDQEQEHEAVGLGGGVLEGGGPEETIGGAGGAGEVKRVQQGGVHVRGVGRQPWQGHEEGQRQVQAQERQEEQGKQVVPSAQHVQQARQQEREQVHERVGGEGQEGSGGERFEQGQASRMQEEMGQTQDGERKGRRKQQRWWKRKRGQQAAQGE